LNDQLANAVVRLAFLATAALTALAIPDYIIKKRRIAKAMRMSKVEVKREAKDADGDPEMKSRRRVRAREIAKHRLAVAVKMADVVVVNPTEYAVALRYKAGKDSAPRVTAKGRGEVAARIREIARKEGIPILPRPPLARLLFKLVPEGREIPAATYQAVAEILAYVYRLRGRRG
jgi:flagellar biosynthesis protein FlhB